jgi:hypothetical protein
VNVVELTCGTVSVLALSEKLKLGATDALTVTWSRLADAPYINTGTLVVSTGALPEVWLATVNMYCPAVAGLVIEPVGILNPYRVVLTKLALVSPETVMVPPSPAPADVTAAVRVPGGAVMLAGVRGKLDTTGVGVPAVVVKPEGTVMTILATVVGAEFNLNTIKASLLLAALMPSRPRRTSAGAKLAEAKSGAKKLSINEAATSNDSLFPTLMFFISFILIVLFFRLTFYFFSLSGVIIYESEASCQYFLCLKFSTVLIFKNLQPQ